METQVNSAICDAMETSLMQIESSFTRGFAGLHIIGNTSEACRDGKERAKAALEALNIFVPPQRILISLTPGDLKKDGNQFDLPFAVSLALLIQQKRPVLDPSQWLFAAELGLKGELKPVRSIISYAISALSSNLRGIVVATENLSELRVLSKLKVPNFNKIQILGFSQLKDVMAWLYLGDNTNASALSEDHEASTIHMVQPNFDDMLLTPELENLAVACGAGMHSVLLRGCPGSGKSMFAARLPSILPKMGKAEHIEALKIQSTYARKIDASLLGGIPPFRSPHHQSSPAAILGNDERPGDLSLSHGGVLFLDEFPEFRRDVLEALREPLESGEVKVSRTKRKLTWKAKVLLIAAANNCPCGWFGSSRKKCRCPFKNLLNYRQRISGPILDRIDIHVNFPEPEGSSANFFVQLNHLTGTSNTSVLSQRVAQARSFALARNRHFNVRFNRDLAASAILQASGLSQDHFYQLIDKFLPKTISNRSMIKTLRVARTLADLRESPTIGEAELKQAWRWHATAAAIERGEELEQDVN